MSWEVPTMQSKTSFFNRTVFWADQRHFWPLTAGFALLWFLVMPLSRLTELSFEYKHTARANVLRDMLDLAGGGGYVVAFCTAILFAMAMFSYLTNPRATSGLHALPARRETLFVTHYLAGLCAQLAVQLLSIVLTTAVLASYGAMDLRVMGLSFLALALPTVFFYSFGVFCMIFTGQLLAAPVFYGILNILVVGVEFLMRAFAGNFLYGWAESSSPVLSAFSPIVELAMHDIGGVVDENKRLLFDGMDWLAVYAVAGVVLAALALLVYRTRPSEETGSTVAIGWAKPIFKYGVALCTALALGQLLYYLFFAQYRASGDYSLPGTLACMAAAGLIGYFTSEMLLKKSFRVFRAGARGAAATVAVLLALGVVLSFDLTGYEGYVPAAEQIESAQVSFNPYNSSPSLYVTLSDEEDLRLLTEAHRALAQDKSRQQNSSTYDKYLSDKWDDDADQLFAYISVNYTLKNGNAVRRAYTPVILERAALNVSGSPEAALTALYNAPGSVLARALQMRGYSDECDPRTLDDLRFTGGYAELDSYDANGKYSFSTELDLTPEQARRIYDAVARDAEQGRVEESFFERSLSFNGSVNLYATYADPRDPAWRDASYFEDTVDGRISITLSPTVTASMSETIDALREVGLVVDVSKFN